MDLLAGVLVAEIGAAARPFFDEGHAPALDLAQGEGARGVLGGVLRAGRGLSRRLIREEKVVRLLDARIQPGVDTTLKKMLFGPTSRTDGTENLVGAIRTSMGVCGATNLAEFHEAELVVAPSIKTEGKAYQLSGR